MLGDTVNLHPLDHIFRDKLKAAFHIEHVPLEIAGEIAGDQKMFFLDG